MVRARDFTQPGALAVVLRVLSLVYHAGHSRRHDLAREAIRLTRQLTLAATEPEPEAQGLLAMMMLQQGHEPTSRVGSGWKTGVDEQDRSLWDAAEIADAVAILQGALAEQRPAATRSRQRSLRSIPTP